MDQQNFSSPDSLQQPSSRGVSPVWAIILLVLVVVLIGVLVWQRSIANQVADSLQNQITALQNQLSQKGNQQGGQLSNCIKEGEGGAYGQQEVGKTNENCCNGLFDIFSVYPLSDGTCPQPSGISFICAACGNGVCGLGENQCNCPADCKSVAANWQSLISDIRKVLGSSFTGMAIYPNQSITIDQTQDITGDGISEALVNAGTGGAATIGLILMRLENNKPVLANFKKSNGEIAPINFLSGSGGAGRYGATTEMLPNKNAIYTGAYMAYGNASSDYCKVEAYQWDAQAKIFNYSAALSSKLQKTYCEGICNNLTYVCNSITDGNVTECLNASKYICP